jgi:hypothetical protein
MRIFALLIPVLLLAACSAPAAEPTAALDLPTAQVLVTETVAVATALPFEAAVYRDAEAGFELQYPAAWFVIGGETQSRGSYVQIISWDAGPNGITEIPAGESVLQITIYQWDPTHDLDARVSMRRNNFVDSGSVILEEEQLSLGGQPAVRFLLQATDGSQALFLILELGDRYLELSGSGDIATLDATMHSLVIDTPSE